MKAMIYTQYGTPDILQYTEVAKPEPKANEVLIKVYAVSINISDYYLLSGKPLLVRLMTGALLKPKNRILGSAVAGRVEAVGANVQRFRVGDAVYGDLSGNGMGGLAEYVSVPESVLAPKPTRLSFEEAATVPLAGVTALQGLRDKGEIQAGQRVLIYGASGGVGTFAVQIAKAFGAEVTAVCSTSKAAMVRELGADRVIDYTREDFTHHGEHYDVVVAINGYRPIREYLHAVRRNGVYVAIGGTMQQIFEALLLGPWLARRHRKTIRSLSAKPDQEDLESMTELLESGQVIPVIDRCYDLSEAADALRDMGEGHTRGKIVVTVAREDQQ